MALLFVSTVFISELISYGNSEAGIIYILISALLYGICIISNKKSICIIKWVASVLFSYYIIQYFWNTDFAIRSLNWVFPEYGNQSAGGKFAGMILLEIQMFIYLICALAGMMIKVKNYKKITIIQLAISALFSVGISFSVIVLESIFPKMTEIFGG